MTYGWWHPLRTEPFKYEGVVCQLHTVLPVLASSSDQAPNKGQLAELT